MAGKFSIFKCSIIYLEFVILSYLLLFSDSNKNMSEEAPEVSAENEDEKAVEDEDVTKVEGDMGDLNIERDENKNEEAPADEIGKRSINNFHTFVILQT
jgi:hypothetical protein